MTKDSAQEFTSEDLSKEHERLGVIVTKLIADYARTLDDRALCSRAAPADLEKLFHEELPREGTDAEKIIESFARDVLPHGMNISSPRYFGQFNPTPLAIGVWADALIAAMNQNGAVWRNSPAASVIETQVTKWLCDRVGYGDAGFGTLASGGSEANLIALKCARDHVAEEAPNDGLRQTRGNTERTERTSGALIVYASEQCHYSLDKSVDIIGVGRRNLRKIETDGRFHIRVDRLVEEIERDVAAGDVPCAIVGVAGTTSTGAIDPLDELARVAEEYKLWFHVDAAYGGALVFSDEHKHILRGLERADSVTIDPHKWMFVPFACGAILVRDGQCVLRRSFDASPEYLSERRERMSGADVEYDLFRYGQLGTRRANSLKLWMCLKLLGARGYARIIDRQIELTQNFARRIDASMNFERAGEVETAVCCFRFTPEEVRGTSQNERDELQQALQQRIEHNGKAWFASTVIKGGRALRVNVNSYLTRERHIVDLVELLEREGAKLSAEKRREAKDTEA